MPNQYTREQIDEAKEWFGAILLSALSAAEQERDAYRKAYYNVANERTDKQEELTAVRSERDALKARCAELEGGLVAAIKSIDEGGAHSVKRIRKMLIEVLDAIVGKKEGV